MIYFSIVVIRWFIIFRLFCMNSTGRIVSRSSVIAEFSYDSAMRATKLFPAPWLKAPAPIDVEPFLPMTFTGLVQTLRTSYSPEYC